MRRYRVILDINEGTIQISMGTRKTSIEIDEQLLEDARRILGTSTIKDTVEEAFLRVLRQKAREEEVAALRAMKGMDLADPDVMASAWRS
jgi:Arc/MetJ family transcription regulator